MSNVEKIESLKRQRMFVAMQWKNKPSEKLFDLWEMVDSNLCKLGFPV